MKIALIVGYIRVGGFQTFLLNVLKLLDQNKVYIDIYYYEIPKTIMDMFPKNNYILMDKPSFFDKLLTLLKLNVMIQYLKEIFKDSKSNKFYCLYLSELAKRGNKIEQEYDKVISLSEHFNLYLNVNFLHVGKRYCWIHPNYVLAKFDKKIDYKYLKRFDSIFAVSKNNAQVLKKEFPCLKEKIDFIENVLDIDYITAMGNERVNNPYEDNVLKMLTVCRITNDSKRVDRMLQIAKQLESESVNFNWVFIGEGPDLESCKSYAKDNNLHSVKFLGNKKNPYPYFKLADLFVLLSEYEGNPYVLKDARIFSLAYLIKDYDRSLIRPDMNCFGLKNDKLLVESATTFIKNYNYSNNIYKLDQSRDISKILELFN
ncbi:MAG: glycosyltransferase [Bacilli bacterium]